MPMPSMIFIVSVLVFPATALCQSPPADADVPSSRVVQDQSGQADDGTRPALPDRMLRGNRRFDDGERAVGRGGFRGRDGGRGGVGRRPITEADIGTMVEIADLISPEWASELRAMMADDPDKAAETIMKSGRRLFGLVMLKERKPELFETRVAELRVQFNIRRTYVKYQAALKAGDAAAIVGYKTGLKTLAAKIVDLELKSRAMELAALDQAVQEMRLKLRGEIENSAERITGMIEDLLKPAPEEAELPESDGSGPAGSRPNSRGTNGVSSTSG